MDQSHQAAVTPKQQIVEAVKGATNVLVTVSRNPNVDQLSACIGLTLMLNKLGKHGTAVFSGAIPSTLEFLQPEKTIEVNTDSLRDFIISLDRNKADKLRYKLEDDVVKIFITPYRTTLSGEDLQFSQGDFNVDVVIALGVDNREHLDEAIIAHGRILHDAKVVGISCGDKPSDVGTINWHEPSASSLSEMLVSISESFQSGLLDPQMSTAFLTGIVAETDRFKNQKTTPKVMTMSAQLMAAGANQQLIATQLALPESPAAATPPPAEPIAEPVTEQPHVPLAVKEIVDTPPPTDHPSAPEPEAPVESPPSHDDATGELDIHDTSDASTEEQSVPLHDEPSAELPSPIDGQEEVKEPDIHIDEQGQLMDGDNQKPKQKVIEPLTMKPSEEPKTDLSTYVFEEPQHNSTFTASTTPEDASMMVDPLSADVTTEKHDTPLLSHDAPPAVPEQAVEEPANSAPNVDDIVSIPPPLTATPPEPTPEVQSQSDAPQEVKIDEDAARQAVLQAMAADSHPAVGPIEALNAQPMPLDQPLIDPSTGQLPPPAVPPPLVPPPDLPLPGQEPK